MADGAQESFQEKTEHATPKRKEDARLRGKVARSMELNSATILVLGLAILYFSGTALALKIESTARALFAASGSLKITPTSIHRLFMEGIGTLILAVAPIAVALLAVGLAVSFAQVGFLFTLKPLAPKWETMNPMNGIKKLFFSRRTLVEQLKNVLKVAIVAFVAYYSLQKTMSESLELMNKDVASIVDVMVRSSFSVGLKVGLAFLALALGDYLYQRFEYERELRMTKQEVKEENKLNEGDPLVKGRIRSIQRRIAYKRMMQEVPKADVVVTNPTHYAVALKYDAEKMNSPAVVAKGADLLAQRIKSIAKEHGVPMVENKVLARALYTTVEIGEAIPEKLFHAVAEVLAYIYRLKNTKNGFRME